jgi:hypothetical protein
MATMKLYLAARYDRRSEMRDVSAALAKAGHFVTSRWIYPRQSGPDLVSAIEDIEDLMEADCLVSFTERPIQSAPWAARGGRHVEFGVALASGKRLVVIGPRENIFHHLPRVDVFPTLGDWLAVLTSATAPS